MDFNKGLITKILFIYFRQREREGERGEKHQCVVTSRALLTRDLACNPGMCPDWESNRRPFGLKADAQSTQPHQPGLIIYFFTSLADGRDVYFQPIAAKMNK